MHNLDRKSFVNIASHVLLWTMFIITSFLHPFEREILKEELWMYKYPYVKSYVPTTTLFVFVFAVPTTVVFLIDTRDVTNVLEGVSLACSLSGIFTGVLKCAVGRPRPDFYNRCFPNGKGDDLFKCTGDRVIVMDGRKSFPSGHAAFAFASMHFTCLYLCSKLKIFESHRGEIWRICLCIIPLILSSLIAASRICDHHHHAEDVIAGSILGTIVSQLVYYQYFNDPSLTLERNLNL